MAAETLHSLEAGIVALLIAIPLLDRQAVQRLIEAPERRATYYRANLVMEWLLAVSAIALSRGQCLRPLRREAADISWLLNSGTSRGVAATIVILFFAMALLPGLRTALHPQLGRKYAEAYRQSAGDVAVIFPQTAVELRWFGLLAMTAGICEEILFRGFLFLFFVNGPLHLGWTATLLLTSLLFGWEHLYQGVGGILSSAAAGFGFGVAYLLTGNLLVPVLLHAAVDLQAVLLFRQQRPSHRKK
jgi:membrane protease YdiL (CAAX protease family)